MIHIYTDGSSLGNPGPGGWGAILVPPLTSSFLQGEGGDEITLSGGDQHTTNNVMELTAVTRAMEYLLEVSHVSVVEEHTGIGLFAEVQSSGALTRIDDEITIYTDSTYVQKGVTERLATRVRRDWRKSKGGKMISNLDLRQRMQQLLPYFTHLDRQRVKGHAGHEMNEKVDDLARGEAEKRLYSI